MYVQGFGLTRDDDRQDALKHVKALKSYEGELLRHHWPQELTEGTAMWKQIPQRAKDLGKLAEDAQVFSEDCRVKYFGPRWADKCVMEKACIDHDLNYGMVMGELRVGRTIHYYLVAMWGPDKVTMPTMQQIWEHHRGVQRREVERATSARRISLFAVSCILLIGVLLTTLALRMHGTLGDWSYLFFLPLVVTLAAYFMGFLDEVLDGLYALDRIDPFVKTFDQWFPYRIFKFDQ